MKEDSVPARLIKNIIAETPVLFQFRFVQSKPMPGCGPCPGGWSSGIFRVARMMFFATMDCRSARSQIQSSNPVSWRI